uniref:3-dehydroquinate dehydratase n=1 Tax=uncultured marine group II/III euryarchaeote KM3_33_F08 TaxID=1456435 RepID=A0A075GY98_9EURY|nr:3-dehydroquinate dehydratase (aroD) [uncultured marine group II/III euryarchaeote KM3_33_F08]
MSLPKVCVSLEGNTVEEIVKQAEKATGEGVELIEVRFDRLYVEKVQVSVKNEAGEQETSTEFVSRPIDDVDVPASIEQLKKSIEKTVLFTCMPRRQGGQFPDDEEGRIEILRQAISSGVSWINLELDIDEKISKELFSAAKEAGCSIVASLHDMEETPSSEDILEAIEDNLEAGDILKLCYQTRGHGDGLSIFEAAWKLRGVDAPSYTIMGMGIGGDWPRIHAPLLDLTIVYTTLDNDFSLPDRGLINLRDLRTAWDMLGYA